MNFQTSQWRTRHQAVLGLFLLLVGTVPAPQALAEKGRLEGRVTDLFGGVIPGAEIVLTDPAGKKIRETESAKDGEFSLRLLPVGSLALVVTFDGFVPARFQIDLRRGERKQLDVGLHVVDFTDSPGCHLSGRVVREGRGTPLAGVWIKAFGAFDPQLAFAAVTGREGRFELRIDQAAQYLVFAQAPGFVVRAKGLLCNGGASKSVRFALAEISAPSQKPAGRRP